MNNNIFSLLGGFNEFGYLFAVPCCQVGIGKEMAYRKIEELLIKQKNCEVVQVQPSSKRIGAEKVKNMLWNQNFVNEDSYLNPRPHTLVNEKKRKHARQPPLYQHFFSKSILGSASIFDMAGKLKESRLVVSWKCSDSSQSDYMNIFLREKWSMEVGLEHIFMCATTYVY